MNRRDAMFRPVAAAAALVSSSLLLGGNLRIEAAAEEETEATSSSTSSLLVGKKKIVVVGAGGQTGRRIIERLASPDNNFAVIGGVRNVKKATESLSAAAAAAAAQQSSTSSSSTTSIVDTLNAVEFKHINVVEDSVDDMASVMEGADALVIATGFPLDNPLNMNIAAHAVENVGTCKLVDAAKASGTVKKIVLVSCILTNGRNWGQESSVAFVFSNSFGRVLDEKSEAEHYLRASGMDYTIVRPGELKSKRPKGELTIHAEDTVRAGEISRDLVADVCVASLTDARASNKVLEIIEDYNKPPHIFNGLVM